MTQCLSCEDGELLKACTPVLLSVQVAGTPVLRALKAAFDGSVDAAAAAPLLEGFATGIR